MQSAASVFTDSWGRLEMSGRSASAKMSDRKQRLIELIGRQQERSSCLVPVPMKDGTETLPDRL